MKALSSDLLTTASVSRQRVYETLTADPQRDWTVKDLTALLPDVSVEAVRTTVHLLLADRLVDIVPRRRMLTVRLNGDGSEALVEILSQWSAGQPSESAREQ
jgi:hypothetical protein